MSEIKTYRVCEPLVTDLDVEKISEVASTGWISANGPVSAEFEAKIAESVSCDHAAVLVNGTAAIEAAVYALDLPKGSEVIMPSFTIISCAVAVIRLGLVPVFVDVEKDILCIDPAEIERAVTSNTSAILVVHIFGHPASMDEILEISHRYNLKIIEDVAEAHGAEYKGRRCGSLGDIATFSFYANKLVTTGEGGAVASNHIEYIERARSYINLCFDKDRKFVHSDVGYNFRMGALQAALGSSQMNRFDDIVKQKIFLGEIYRSCLDAIDGVSLLAERSECRSVYWMYGIMLDAQLGLTADAMIKELDARGIQARYFFKGLHTQSVLAEYAPKDNPRNFENTENAYSYGLYVPSSLTLNEHDINYICGVIRSIVYQDR
jgi:perosamine synthetase